MNTFLDEFVQGLKDGFRNRQTTFPDRKPGTSSIIHDAKQSSYDYGYEAGSDMRRELLSEVSRATNAQGYGR